MNLISLLLFFFLLIPDKGNFKKIQKEADKAFEAGNYTLAIPLYQQLASEYPESAYAIYRLAHAHDALLHYQEALPLYRELKEDFVEEYPLEGFYYARSLKLNNRLRESVYAFQDFEHNLKIEELPKGDQKKASILLEQARIERGGCYLALSERKEDYRTVIFSRMENGINSPSNDYAPVLFQNGDTLAIASSRKTPGTKLNALGESNEEIYLYTYETNMWDEYVPKDRFNQFNTTDSEAPGCFSPDGLEFYFVRCEEKSGCKILMSKKENGQWLKPKLLGKEVNFPKYNSKQPALSYSGDTLYFVSDRPKGKGGDDIYYAIRNKKDKWVSATNVEAINSPGREMAPHMVAQTGKIIFSSDGHHGYGGQDLFIWDSHHKDQIINLGTPYNTPYDETCMVTGAEMGYLSSNRRQESRFDIYEMMWYDLDGVLDDISTISMEANRTINWDKFEASYPNGVEKQWLKKNKTRLMAELYYKTPIPVPVEEASDELKRIGNRLAIQELLEYPQEAQEDWKIEDKNRWETLNRVQQEKLKTWAENSGKENKSSAPALEKGDSYDSFEDKRLLAYCIKKFASGPDGDHSSNPAPLVKNNADSIYMHQEMKQADSPVAATAPPTAGGFQALKKEFNHSDKHENPSNNAFREVTRTASPPATVDNALAFYRNLSEKDQLRVDRIIAQRWANRIYLLQPHLLAEDLKTLQQLEPEEKKLLEQSKQSFWYIGKARAIEDFYTFTSTQKEHNSKDWKRLSILFSLKTDQDGFVRMRSSDWEFLKSLSEPDIDRLKILSLRIEETPLLSCNGILEPVPTLAEETEEE
ncbi:tetratricopeptide repeat protein [Persicobacter diffluens]|uniref:Tetratricopeptide repeat protein n=1 Tax=Persicobacter diffluens TaxID=981 RepID=A0AAN5ALL6_9BACT|nr:hypothetical protein PEDI_35040 [Persicobacter diffluens]